MTLREPPTGDFRVDSALVVRAIAGVPTVVDIGFDHYFFDPMMGHKAVALVRAVEACLTPAGIPPAAPRTPVASETAPAPVAAERP